MKAAPLFALLLVGATASADGFDIAITVDDLPAHGPLPNGMTRLGIAQSYLATLKRHGVPEAYGFVNAAKLEREPGSEAVLDAWRAAGYPLANHAYSHMSLARAPSFDAWSEDVILGEPAVAARMAGADWHFFRFPNLDVSAERREPALALLTRRGYKVADVSVAFGDWVYTDAYARCASSNQQDTIAAMRRAAGRRRRPLHHAAAGAVGPGLCRAGRRQPDRARGKAERRAAGSPGRTGTSGSTSAGRQIPLPLRLAAPTLSSPSGVSLLKFGLRGTANEATGSGRVGSKLP